MKTSTITSVQGNGTWEGPHGLLYSFELRLNNGDHILLNAKSENPFSIGQELSYELTGKSDRNQTPYAKKVNPNFIQQQPVGGFTPPSTPGGDDRQKSIEIQMAFKTAMDYVCGKSENIGNVVEYAKFIYDQVQDAKRSF
jgi:hypothetical protein